MFAKTSATTAGGMPSKRAKAAVGPCGKVARSATVDPVMRRMFQSSDEIRGRERLKSKMGNAGEIQQKVNSPGDESRGPGRSCSNSNLWPASVSGRTNW